MGRAAAWSLVASCLLAACSAAPDAESQQGGGGCVFAVEWNGVQYVDPVLRRQPVRPPEHAGRYLGEARDTCVDGGTSATRWRLHAIPGVDPAIAVTTEDARYVGVAEGVPVPAALVSPRRTASSTR